MESRPTLEERIERIEKHLGLETPNRGSTSSDIPNLWALEYLESGENTTPTNPQASQQLGTIVFAGVTNGYRYQWERPTEHLTDIFEESLERIAALTPARAGILKQLLEEPTTPHKLVELNLASSVGSAYHHLNALVTAGWVTKSQGKFSVKASRVIPLLTLIACGEDH